MNNEKGQPVFSDNIDEILADKIVTHTKKSASDAQARKKAPSVSAKAEKATNETLGCQTLGRKQRRRALRRYGIAALALLGLLGILTFLLSKFRKN